MMVVDRLQDLQQATAMAPPPPPVSPIVINNKGKDKKSKGKKSKKGKKGVTFAPSPPTQPPSIIMEMDNFYKQMDQVNEGLEKIRQNCDAVEMAHQVIINSVSEIEITEQEKIISAFTSSTNKTSAGLRQALQSMDTDNERLAKVAPPGSGDLRIRKLNTANLMQKFSELMKKFQEIQKLAQNRNQEQVERQYKIMKPQADREELEQVTEAVGAMTLTCQQIFALGSTKDPLATLEQMKSRRKDVMDIEKGIYTLHQLCVDFDNLLETQQGVLDSLEDHIESTVTFSEEAQGHMIEAVESQKNIRRLKCNIF